MTGYCNLHTHSIFSDGFNTPEENILAAIDQGMVSLGFSDHSYTEFDLRYCMRPMVIDAYIREVRRLAAKYADQIEIYLGMEYDGYSTVENRDAYDYFIGDCHYIYAGGSYHSVDHAKQEQMDAIQKYFNGDALAYARCYYETYADRIRAIKPQILGHFDVCAKFGHMDESSPQYRKAATDALLASMEVTPIVEMNTGAISRGIRPQAYPADFLLKEIKDHGGKIILSSDSHKTANLTAYFDRCVDMLKAAGFKDRVILHKGVFEEVGL